MIGHSSKFQHLLLAAETLRGNMAQGTLILGYNFVVRRARKIGWSEFLTMGDLG